MCARIYVNKLALQKTFQRQPKQFKIALDNSVIPALEAQKQKLIDEINNDPTSIELEDKTSELFGFIGFDQDGDSGVIQDDPVGDLIDTIEETTIIPDTHTNIRFITHNKVNAQYMVQVTNTEDLEENDQLRFPWGLHSNWVMAIERGISGLTKFLIGNKKGSRSHAGLQSKYETGRSEYQPRRYFSYHMRNFIDAVTKTSSYVSTRYNIRDSLGRFTKFLK